MKGLFRIAACVSAMALAASALVPARSEERTHFPVRQVGDANPAPATARALQQFNDDRFAMFIHWGLYSQAGGIFHGKRYYGLSEWLMHNAKASPADYLQLADTFDPVDFDAREWVRVAKAAGVRYIVITAKHHDGFAMFGTKASPLNIVDATPFHRDPLKELAKAAHDAGIGLGFYYSQFQDWNDPNGGGNDWSRDPSKIDFDFYFQHKVVPQVTELLTRYGPVREIWFDTPETMPAQYSQALALLVKRLQPGCLLNSRIGNGLGDYTSPDDSEILPNAFARSSWEAVFPFNHSWGYSKFDTDYKSTATLIRMLATAASRGGNIMLNMGPDGLGRFPPEATQRLLDVGSWVKLSGASIYGTRRSPLPQMPWGVVTARPGTLYLHVMDAPDDGHLRVPGLTQPVTAAKLLATGDTLGWKQEAGGLTIELPARLPDSRDTVIALSVAGTLNDGSLGPIVLSRHYGRQVLNTADAHGEGVTLTEIRTELLVPDDRKFYTWTGLDAPDKAIVWQVQVEQPGDYHLDLEYAADLNQGGREGVVEMEGQRIDFRVNSGHEIRRREVAQLLYQPVGLLHFTHPGIYEIRVRPQDARKSDLFALRTAYLTPAN